MHEAGFRASYAENFADVWRFARRRTGTAAAADDVTASRTWAPVRGDTTRHYRMQLDVAAQARLTALTPAELSWFELEEPRRAAALEVWVGQDLIRRIHVDFVSGAARTSTTTEFFDFGAPITIKPPA